MTLHCDNSMLLRYDVCNVMCVLLWLWASPADLVQAMNCRFLGTSHNHVWFVSFGAAATVSNHTTYVQDFDALALSNCLWAFAQLRHHPGDALLEAAALHICCYIDAFPPQVFAACC